PRDLNAIGRELKGVHFAMTYLTQQNRVNAGQKFSDLEHIDAKGKHVVVLGGGDTGSDCVGTANRQGALSVKQYELLPEPPKERADDNPWPQWANTLRTSTSHQEGVERDYCIMTNRFNGQDGNLTSLQAVRVEFGEKDAQTGRAPMKEIAGSGFDVKCDLVFLAMGFLGPVKNGLMEQLGLDVDARGNVQTNDKYLTSKEGVFACGDVHSGQSLVVRAINEGRQAAASVDKWLMAKKVV
ncbi:FAD-dependent oxidoreductase, partial [Candidatus Omnitrophota bacterium]